MYRPIRLYLALDLKLRILGSALLRRSKLVFLNLIFALNIKSLSSSRVLILA